MCESYSGIIGLSGGVTNSSKSHSLSESVSEYSSASMNWRAIELYPFLCGDGTGVDLLPPAPLDLSLGFYPEFVLMVVVFEPLGAVLVLSLDFFSFHRTL